MKSSLFKTNRCIAVLFVAALLVSSMVGCTKESDKEGKSESKIKNMMTFTSEEEFENTLSDILLMNNEELVNFENNKTFKSFGALCDEMYSNITPEEFGSFDEIKTFAEENKKYFQLFEDDEGNHVFETVLYNDPVRHIINEDQMYQIGSRVYKVIGKDVHVSADLQNADMLLSVSKTEDVGDLNQLSVHVKNSDTKLKACDDCGPQYGVQYTNGRDRIQLDIYISIADKRTFPNSEYLEYARVYHHHKVRPYLRTAGAFFKATRTCLISGYCGLEYSGGGTWKSSVYNPIWVLNNSYSPTYELRSSDYGTRYSIELYFIPYEVHKNNLQVRYCGYNFVAEASVKKNHYCNWENYPWRH